MDSYTDQAAYVPWRRQLGYVSEYGSDFQTIHILLGHFLADRTSAPGHGAVYRRWRLRMGRCTAFRESPAVA
jgi:hypothetical protein